MIPKVKICGIKDPDIAQYTIDSGADYIGINFSNVSKRKVSFKEAESILNRLEQSFSSEKPFQLVALFYKNSESEIEKVLSSFSFDFLQYIKEDDSFHVKNWRNNKIPFMLQMAVESDIEDSDLEFSNDLFILDSYSKKLGGGTGNIFPWEFIKNIKRKYLLAGGLNPTNVTSAINVLHPFGVDVASGVESEPGKKDKKLIKEFIQNAKRA
jgi:phosphoribosylanthranilate isomerase